MIKLIIISICIYFYTADCTTADSVGSRTSNLGGLLSVQQVTNAENLYELGIKQLEESIKLLEYSKLSGNKLLGEYTQTVQYVVVHVGPNGSFIKFSQVINHLLSQIHRLEIGLKDALSHVDPFLNRLKAEKLQLAVNQNIISQGARLVNSKVSTQLARDSLIRIKKSLEALELSNLNSGKLKTIAIRIDSDIKNAIKNMNSLLNILLGYRVTFNLIIDSEKIFSESEKIKTNIFDHSKLCQITTNEIVNLQHMAKSLFQNALKEGLLFEDINVGKNYILQIDAFVQESNKLIAEMNAKWNAMVSSIKFIKKAIDKLKLILSNNKYKPHAAYKKMDIVHVEIDEIFKSIGVALRWANAAVQSNFSILTSVRETLQALEALIKISKKSHSMRSSYTNLTNGPNPGSDPSTKTDYSTHSTSPTKYVLDDENNDLEHSGHDISSDNISSRHEYYIKKFGSHDAKNTHSILDYTDDTDCTNHKCHKNYKKDKPWYKKLGIKAAISNIQNLFGLTQEPSHNQDYDRYHKMPPKNYVIPTAPPIDLVPDDIPKENIPSLARDTAEKAVPTAPVLEPTEFGTDKLESALKDDKHKTDSNSTETQTDVDSESNKSESKITETDATEPIDDKTKDYTDNSTNPEPLIPATTSTDPINQDLTVDQNANKTIALTHPTTTNPQNPSSNPNYQLVNQLYPNDRYINHGSLGIEANLFGNLNLENLQMAQQDPTIKELIIKGKEFFKLFNAAKMRLMSGKPNLSSKMLSIMLTKAFQNSLSNLCYNFMQNKYYYDPHYQQGTGNTHSNG